MSLVAAPGFGPLDIGDLKINGGSIPIDFHNSITDVIVQRTILGASTLTIQLTDPHRLIVNNLGYITKGTTVEIPDGFGNYLQFAFVQINKASDQLQITFESRSVYDLRQLRGVISSSDVTDVGSFVQNICNTAGIPFVGPAGNPFVQPTFYAAATGSTVNPDEDAWASIQRIAGTMGWRAWESAGTVFFGPDEYWYAGTLAIVAAFFGHTYPPVNAYYNHSVPVLKEFNEDIQLIDFDWDVGSAFGDMTITCMSHFWQYNPGEIVYIEGMGPASGAWIVKSMQRNFFNPQAAIVCTQPMPAATVLNPPTLPIVGGRYY